MAERARAAWWWIDEFGSRIPGATVEVRNAANSAAVSDTLYAADDPDTSVLPNPFTSDVNGKAEAYLANSKRAIFRFSKTGYTTQDVPVDFTFAANRFIFRNAWVNTTSYAANDVVTYGGESWVALRASTGVTPVAGADWALMAAKGATQDLSAYQALSDLAFARKTVDESVASSTTLQNDDTLLFAVGANQVWQFEATIFVTGLAAADFNMTFAGPAGSAGTWALHGLATTTTTDEGDARIRAIALGTAVAVGLASTIRIIPVYCKGIIRNGANAGNLQLQWAQNVADATATTVVTDSHLRAWKVA